MHSYIFQISNKPIGEDEYNRPSTYWDNSADFADYIGDVYEDLDRREGIDRLADIIKDVFTQVTPGVFVYKGHGALQAFKQKWADGIKAMAAELTADNLFKEQRLHKIRKATEETHIGASSRVDIEGWTAGVAYPLGELFEYAASRLKARDRIYIGAVIDYHC